MCKRGIEELRRPDFDDPHLALQLLAQGLERLLKLTYALAFMRHHGTLPTVATFKRKYGHNLMALCDDLLGLVRDEPRYANRPAVREDLDFIAYDADLRRYLQLLSTFGTWSRYYRFQQFLGDPTLLPEDDPDKEWDRLETDALVRSGADWFDVVASPTGAPETRRRIALHITSVLSRFTRALTWMWTLGAVHDDARLHISAIADFVFLKDDEVGGGAADKQPRR